MKTIRVLDLGNVITGHTPPTRKREYYGNFMPFIKPTDISKGTKYTYITEECYSKAGYEKYKSSLIPKNATCVVCIGTLGEKMTMAHCDCFTNQSMNSIIPNSSFDPHYVYYLLKNNLQSVKALNKGTASGREFVSKSSFLEMKLDVIEDIFVQRKIGNILSAYDDLIENNRRQIKLLEEAAQRLYKEWFVDLHFPGWETTPIVDGLPEGWRRTVLSDVAAINMKSVGKDYPHQNIEYVDIGSVRLGIIEETASYCLSEAPGRAKRLASDGDIIWGMVRPNLKAYALVMNPTDDMVFSTGFSIITPVKAPFSFIYAFVTQDSFVGYLVNCTNGAAYPAVKPIHFERARILLPDTITLQKFHAFAEPLFRKIDVLNHENHNFLQARDALLPKLMSGELEV